MLFQRLNVSAKLKSILEQRQISHISRRSGGIHFCDDGCQFPALRSFMKGGPKTLDIVHGDGSRDSRRTSDPFQIRASAGDSWKSADGQQALVIENDVSEVVRTITCQLCQTVEGHLQLVVTIENNNALIR